MLCPAAGIIRTDAFPSSRDVVMMPDAFVLGVCTMRIALVTEGNIFALVRDTGHSARKLIHSNVSGFHNAFVEKANATDEFSLVPHVRPETMHFGSWHLVRQSVGIPLTEIWN